MNIDGMELIPSQPRVQATKEEMRKHLKYLLDKGYSLEEIAQKTGQSLRYLNKLLEEK